LLKNSIKIKGGLILAIVIVISFAGCFLDNGGEENYYNAWFEDIDPTPGSIVEASVLDISGYTTCPECAPMTDWLSDCIDLDCPESTSIGITWSNTTNSTNGTAIQKIVNECHTFFGWCRCECVHKWSASIPLVLGTNEVVITATDPSLGADAYPMTFTRLLERPSNIVTVVENYKITISWDSVPEATSYDLYYSTDKTFTTDTANKIVGVTSPYSFWGIPDVPHYFLIKAVNGEHESNASDMVIAVPGWFTETVSETESYTSTSIAVDSLGNPHIHYSTSNYDLGLRIQNTYATKKAGAWTTILVGEPSDRDADIALGANDTVHISYIESAGLTHSLYSANIWLSSVADPEAYDNATLALDSQDNVHIAYRGGVYPNQQLRYAHNTSGNWASTTLDSISGFNSLEGHHQTGRWISLDVEANGTAHIAYEGSRSETGLRYATNQGGMWSFSTVDPDNMQQLSLAVDSNGKAHIIYSDYYGQLKYAHNTAGGWLVEQVETEVRSYYPSLALDSAGKVHIVYFNTLHDEVRYATNASGMWRILPIDTVGDINTALGVRTDIALDSNNKVYLSYNHRNTSIKFTTNR